MKSVSSSNGVAAQMAVRSHNVSLTGCRDCSHRLSGNPETIRRNLSWQCAIQHRSSLRGRAAGWLGCRNNLSVYDILSCLVTHFVYIRFR